MKPVLTNAALNYLKLSSHKQRIVFLADNRGHLTEWHGTHKVNLLFPLSSSLRYRQKPSRFKHDIIRWLEQTRHASDSQLKR